MGPAREKLIKKSTDPETQILVTPTYKEREKEP